MGVCMLCGFRKWCIIKHCYFDQVNSLPKETICQPTVKDICGGMAICGGGVRSRDYVHYDYSSSYQRSKSVSLYVQPFSKPGSVGW